jgi:hypothetical protein
MEGDRTGNGKAGMLAHTDPAFIAVSFHRLFLSGLLPSRARFRFAGLLAIRRYMKAAQGAVCRKFRGQCGCVRSEWRGLAKQIELPVVKFGLESFMVTADLGQVGGLEFQGKLHQRIGDVSGGFVGDAVVG